MATKDTNGPQIIDTSASDRTFTGGNDMDSIMIQGSANTLTGNNGNDMLWVFGADNTLSGGNGEDVLSAVSAVAYSAPANVLDGGRGMDTFFTEGNFSSAIAGVGALITGGSGPDQFHLRQDSDVMLNNEDSYGHASVQEGDTVQGVFDVITDYAAGELIDIGATTLRTEPVGLTHMWAGHSHLTLNDGEYAFIHGNWGGEGEFSVAQDGADLLVVYDYDPAGEYYFEYGGSVVLVGVSNEAMVNIGTMSA